jgi:hypothetical protein
MELMARIVLVFLADRAGFFAALFASVVVTLRALAYKASGAANPSRKPIHILCWPHGACACAAHFASMVVILRALAYRASVAANPSRKPIHILVAMAMSAKIPSC